MNPAPTRHRRLVLMPLVSKHRADETLVSALVPLLHDAFQADVFVAAAITLPEKAYNPTRRQYHSTALLETLARQKKPDWTRLLGVADVDLYTPDLNFVFGEADARRGVAVFSVARLLTDDRARLVHRAATEAIHEIGHTYDLHHCQDPRCVMWFSNTLAETDRKGTRLCPAHARALQQRIAADHP